MVAFFSFRTVIYLLTSLNCSLSSFWTTFLTSSIALSNSFFFLSCSTSKNCSGAINFLRLFMLFSYRLKKESNSDLPLCWRNCLYSIILHPHVLHCLLSNYFLFFC